MGKWYVVAMGVALLWCGRVTAGEAAGAHALVSPNRNAALTLGGEMRTDYAFRRAVVSGAADRRDPRLSKTGDLSLRNVNLRLLGRLTPSVAFSFKMDFTARRPRHLSDDIIEEALLVMESVGGTGLGLVVGRGRAPYGQDISLGMLQSYHHAANHDDSPEGLVHIIEPPRSADRFRPDRRLAPMRPGQMVRATMAGLSWSGGAWKAEAALFQPEREEYDARLRPGRGGTRGVDVGAAARVWWAPVEELTVELSGLLSHSTDMGRAGWRGDIAPGTRATQNARAVSAGFDWRPGRWRLFGEYQHAWDWNFTSGYDTDTVQLGGAWAPAERWRIGTMAEGLRIRTPGAWSERDDFAKLAVTIRHDFTAGVFLLFEYGHEWHWRRRDGETVGERRGHFLGMRLGLTF